MNQEEANILLEKGVKLTHRMFQDYEWIMKHPKSGVHYLDERGNVIGINDFWRWRTGPKWDQDWTVYLKQ